MNCPHSIKSVIILLDRLAVAERKEITYGYSY